MNPAVKLILWGILYGLRDSILGLWAIWFIDEEIKKKNKSSRPKKDEGPLVTHRVFQCCLLNGGVFLCSILLFNYVVIPISEYVTTIFLGSVGMRLWSFLYPLLHFVFSALWVLPLFVLSRIVNSLWFMDIADRAYRQIRGRPQTIPSYSKFVADMLFSLLIQMFFLIQSMLVTLVPLIAVGEIVAALHLSLLYSLYAFEYRWFNMGWELHNRLSFIENNWPYFLGFGFPLTVLTSLPSSQVVSGCIFSMAFPLLIISANEAEPLTKTSDYPLRLFSPVVALSNCLFHRVMKTK